VDNDLHSMDAAIQSFFDQWARSRHRAFAVQMTIASRAPNGAVVIDIRDGGDVNALTLALMSGECGVNLGQKDARDGARAGEGLPKQARKPRNEG